jgi:hypothetical protein
MNTQTTHNPLIDDISSMLSIELPGFWHRVHKYKSIGGEFISIQIACSNYLINNVEGQRPQAVSLCLNLSTLELYPQVYAGCGGQKIYRNINPNNPDEKYLAMKGVKIPFRKPSPTLESIFKAISKFCSNYKKTLIENIETLRYKDIVDYNKLLNLQ